MRFSVPKPVLAFAIPWSSRWVRQSQQNPRPEGRLAVVPVILSKPTRAKRKAALFACLRRLAFELYQLERELAELEAPRRAVVLSRSFSMSIAESRADIARLESIFARLCRVGEEHGLLPDPEFFDPWPRA